VAAERLAGLPRADVLLLLPSIPSTAAVLGPDSAWGAALEHWGVAVGAASSADLLVATGGVPAAGALGAPMILLPGARRLGRLRRAGYTVTTYRVRWISWHVVVATPDRRGPRLARRTWAPAGVGARGRVARVLRPGAVSVATLGGDGAPATLRMSGAAPSSGVSRTCVAVDVRDARRRAAFLVPDAGGGVPTVVKAARSPGQESRGPREQRVLGLLPDDGVTPRPLGAGHAGPVEWSAETAVRGRPLRELESGHRELVLPVLETLAVWLGDVAIRTAVPMDWRSAGAGDTTVALRGPAAGLGRLLTGLGDVPAVLSHGDLASGHNVVVDRSGRAAVLDWETAREHGLPLQDLLPLLCSSLARVHGRRHPEREGDHVLALATGRSPESRWLFAQVAGYADRLGLLPASLGPLALLAWGHQASMRQVRDELLATAGLPAGKWTSLAERVLPRWEDEVGADWPQLRAHLH